MQQFLDTYQKLNAGNLDLLKTIYTPDVHFVDPVHEVHGLPQLRAYFFKLYEAVTSIGFEFYHPVGGDTEGYVQWVMRYSYPKIKGGEEVAVPGATFLKFAHDKKATYHRDYFDLGDMIYRHVPLLGKMIGGINRRVAL